jgi:excisionase family DNA binding protein
MTGGRNGKESRTPARDTAPTPAVGWLPAEPLSVRISTAVTLTGISRSRIYELIQAGDLQTVKLGRTTLIPFSSLRRLIERL